MPKKIHIVNLNDKEIEKLKNFVSKGERKAREITRARILLLSHEGKIDSEITESLKVSRKTIHNIRTRYCKEEHENIVELLRDKPRPGAPIKYDSTVAANVSMIACSSAPEGSSTWTLKLIADKIVQLEVAESISTETIRRILKKTN